jgi:hypothetical protein
LTKHRSVATSRPRVPATALFDQDQGVSRSHLTTLRMPNGTGTLGTRLVEAMTVEYDRAVAELRGHLAELG